MEARVVHASANSNGNDASLTTQRLQ